MRKPNHVDVAPLKIEHKPLASLRLNGRNARRHDRAQIRKLARSIEAFGFVVPIVTDSNSQIVAGHGRFLAAQQLQLSQVPTIPLAHLSDAQLQAFSIADNRLTEISSWDDKLLAENLKILSALELDFPLEATGFDIGEVDVRIENLDKTEADSEPAEPLPAPGPQITQAGDLWHLGRHRVYCGSAIEPNSFHLLMDGKKARAVVTDPPFNVRIDGHVSGLGRAQHREFAMARGEMDARQFTEFLRGSFELIKQNSVDGAIVYAAMDWRHMREILAAAENLFELKNLCVWTKNNAGMGSFYRSQHELFFVFKSGSRPHRNNIQLGRFGRGRTNVWSYAGANAFGLTSEEGLLPDEHPTPKPTRLIADAILDCTNRNDIVVDPFLGSGTSVIAAERTGRRCYGIEIDPIYVDLIVRRWQSYTGELATHARTHATFDSSKGNA